MKKGKVRLRFLGSGSAFTVGSQNYQSNMLLEDSEGRRLMIDCGSDARHSLYEQGLTYKDIHDVYISHLHADHIGGLEWLAFTTKFDPKCSKINLYINESLVKPLWENSLSGSLCCLSYEQATLSSYFELQSIPTNGYFTWQGIKCQLIQTIHTVGEYSVNPSFGLFLDIDGYFVFITTDSQLAPNQIKQLYQKADLIFQDCETTSSLSGVHAHYQQLIDLDPQIKAKMWLYHYSPGALPDAIKDGFKGFVKKGQSFELGQIEE